MNGTKPNPVSEAIRHILTTEVLNDGCTAEDVNDGNCEWFAERVVSMVPEAEVMWDDIITIGEPGGAHAFVHYEGRFYDSETPDGISDWGALPCFVRHRRLQWHVYQQKQKRAAKSS